MTTDATRRSDEDRRVKVLAFGSREWPFPGMVRERLSLLHQEYPWMILIEGGARGVDSISGEWAADAGIGAMRYTAKWDEHGKRAGLIRNQLMLDDGKPDMFVGWILDESPGSMDMLNRLRKAKIPGEVVYAYS